mmetsp:Transcript_13537/g.29397  ORF Transcript_13537/g.29397 Transcript_13537/m.29397 type:complete len:268 (-) Transcript_13537:1368-2171(-)
MCSSLLSTCLIFLSISSSLVTALAIINRSVAASQDSSLDDSSQRGSGMFFMAKMSWSTASSNVSYISALGNCSKNMFDGCRGIITNFPIAKASAVVVHNTSDTDGFKNILSGMCLVRAWSITPRKFAGTGCRLNSKRDCGGSNTYIDLTFSFASPRHSSGLKTNERIFFTAASPILYAATEVAIPVLMEVTEASPMILSGLESHCPHPSVLPAFSTTYSILSGKLQVSVTSNPRLLKRAESSCSALCCVQSPRSSRAMLCVRRESGF